MKTATIDTAKKTSKELLENFNIFDLDEFAYFQYTTHHILHMPKVEAL